MKKVDIEEFKVKPGVQDELANFSTKPQFDSIDDSDIQKQLGQNTEKLIE